MKPLLLLVGPEFNLRHTDLKRTIWVETNGSPGTPGKKGVEPTPAAADGAAPVEIDRGEHTFSLPRRDFATEEVEKNKPNPRPKHATAAEIRNEPMEPTLGVRI